jgi:hypothetical protein
LKKQRRKFEKDKIVKTGIESVYLIQFQQKELQIEAMGSKITIEPLANLQIKVNGCE